MIMTYIWPIMLIPCWAFSYWYGLFAVSSLYTAVCVYIYIYKHTYTYTYTHTYTYPYIYIARLYSCMDRLSPDRVTRSREAILEHKHYSTVTSLKGLLELQV